MIKKILLILCCIFSLTRLWADVSVQAQVDQTVVALGQTLRLNVTVSGSSRAPDPQLPDLDAFSVYSSGRSQNISIINGKMTSSTVYSYGLVPKGIGKFTIDPVRVKVDGKEFTSDPILIEVVQDLDPAASPQGARVAKQSRSIKDAFVQLTLDRKQAYLGQRILMTFQFFYRLPLASSPQYQAPALTGFLSQNLDNQKEYTQTVKGVLYRVLEIKTALFPTQEGKLTIPPAELLVRLEDLSGNSSTDDFFASFFGGNLKEYRLQTDPVSIQIMPLPLQGKSDAFTGGVGQFKMSVFSDQKEVPQGQAVTLNLKVSGQGNLSAISVPQFPALNGFRQYDTITSLDSGSKNFKVILIPQVSGAQKIGAFTMQYFDIQSKQYVTLKTDPIDLTVIAASDQPQNNLPLPSGSLNAAQVQQLQKDIRYLQPRGNEKTFNGYLYKKSIFKGLFVFPIVAFLIILVIKKYVLQRDSSRLRFSSAFQKAKSAQRKIDFSKQDSEGQIFAILQQYIADKLSTNATQISLKMLQEIWTQNDFSQEIFEELKKLWNSLEQARYAPQHLRSQNVQNANQQLLVVLQNLEKTFSQKSKSKLLKTVVVIFAVFALNPLHSADLWRQAEDLYKKGDYAQAAQRYQTLSQNKSPSSVLAYNWGNACYKAGQTGKALALWTHAWRLDPFNKDIFYNLDLVSRQVSDPVFSDFIFVRQLQKMFWIVSLNGLNIIVVLLVWILCVLSIFYLFKKEKKIVFAMILSAIFLVLCSVWSFARWRVECSQKWGIVQSDKLELRSGPGEQFTGSYVVGQGLRACLLSDDPESNWVEVGIPKEGIKAWAPRSGLAMID